MTSERAPNGVWFLGHSTVAIDLDGTRILTDPVLGNRVVALGRRLPVAPEARRQPVDAVVISHLHYDHLDLPSLRLLGLDTCLLVPSGAGRFLARRGFRQVREARPGDQTPVGSLQITATPALHDGFRPPFGPRAGCLGFLVEGSRRVYFAGDTDLFPEMAELGPVDVALLPVGGWGPRLGPGHLNPERAALALLALRPRLAIPIHWGTLAPLGFHLRAWSYQTKPPLDFLAAAREVAPAVEVRLLQPGEFLALDELAGPSGPSAGSSGAS